MRSFETVRIAHPPKMRATVRVPDAEMAITVFACKRAMRIQTGEAVSRREMAPAAEMPPPVLMKGTEP
jgi:hypothetical protein